MNKLLTTAVVTAALLGLAGTTQSQNKKTLHVCAYQIPDVGSGPLESPVLALDQTLSFEEAVVSFTLQQFYHSDAYEVVISPFHQCPR